MTRFPSRRPFFSECAIRIAGALLLTVIALLSTSMTLHAGEAAPVLFQVAIDDLRLDETPTTPPPTGMGAVQAIAYLALILAVGLPWFRAFVLKRVDEWSVRVAHLAGAIAILAHILIVPFTRIWEQDGSTSDLLTLGAWQVEPGHGNMRALIFVVIGLIFVLGYMQCPLSQRSVPWAIFLGGMFALGSLTVVGHTATLEPAWIVHGADFLHGLAAAFWFGGLVGLGRFLRVARRPEHPAEPRPLPADAARVVARFSWLAGWAVAALAISGSVIAFKVLGSWDALLHTTYGRVLIAKLSLVLIPFGFAIWNRLRLVPSVQSDPEASSAWNRLRATVLTEAGLLVVVLSLTGFLVLQNPAVAGSDGVEAVAAGPFEETEALGEGSLEITITPAMTGENEISLMVHDADGLPIQLLDDPEIRLMLPEVELGRITSTATWAGHPGHYAAQVQVPIEGEWTVEVVTRISKYEEPITTFTVPIPHLPD
jgi:copper transport protein